MQTDELLDLGIQIADALHEEDQYAEPSIIPACF
jgi:hypothetical protein